MRRKVAPASTFILVLLQLPSFGALPLHISGDEPGDAREHRALEVEWNSTSGRGAGRALLAQFPPENKIGFLFSTCDCDAWLCDEGWYQTYSLSGCWGCTKCPTKCRQGEFLGRHCTRFATPCIPCSTCGENEFVSTECAPDGTTDTGCVACSQCSLGTWRSRNCSATADAECRPCGNALPEHARFNGDFQLVSITATNASTEAPAVGDAEDLSDVSARCDWECNPGFLKAGDGTCQCPEGQSVAVAEDKSSCLPCIACAPGSYETAPCTTDSARVCEPCPNALPWHAFFTTAFADGACEWECLRGGQRVGGSCVCQPGFWDNSTATGTAGGCEECTRCEEGRQYETSPCVSTVGAGADRACAACTSAKPEHSHYTDFKGPGAGECDFLCDEHYWFDSDFELCKECTDCPAGQFQTGATCAHATGNNPCQACPNEAPRFASYDGAYNYLYLFCSWSCAPGLAKLGSLGGEEYCACANETEWVREDEAGGAECVACSAGCPAGYFVSAPCAPRADRECSQCSACTDGTGVAAPCSGAADTVCLPFCSNTTTEGCLDPASLNLTTVEETTSTTTPPETTTTTTPAPTTTTTTPAPTTTTPASEETEEETEEEEPQTTPTPDPCTCAPGTYVATACTPPPAPEPAGPARRLLAAEGGGGENTTSAEEEEEEEDGAGNSTAPARCPGGRLAVLQSTSMQDVLNTLTVQIVALAALEHPFRLTLAGLNGSATPGPALAVAHAVHGKQAAALEAEAAWNPSRGTLELDSLRDVGAGEALAFALTIANPARAQPPQNVTLAWDVTGCGAPVAAHTGVLGVEVVDPFCKEAGKFGPDCAATCADGTVVGAACVCDPGAFGFNCSQRAAADPERALPPTALRPGEAAEVPPTPGGVGFRVPSGALGAPATLYAAVYEVAPSLAPEQAALAPRSAVAVLGPPGLRFDAPIALTLSAPALATADAAPASGRTLAVRTLNTQTGLWEALPSRWLVGGLVEGMTTHFSSFAIFEADDANATLEATCAPCALPRNASAAPAAPGGPECNFVCRDGFFRAGAECRPCSGACPDGMFFTAACNQTADRQCAPCTAVRPAYSRYTAANPPDEDACGWECDAARGFGPASAGPAPDANASLAGGNAGNASGPAPAEGAGDCACASGFTARGAPGAPPRCVACHVCPPGKLETAQCSTANDTRCATCPNRAPPHAAFVGGAAEQLGPDGVRVRECAWECDAGYTEFPVAGSRFASWLADNGGVPLSGTACKCAAPGGCGGCAAVPPAGTRLGVCELFPLATPEDCATSDLALKVSIRLAVAPEDLRSNLDALRGALTGTCGVARDKVRFDSIEPAARRAATPPAARGRLGSGARRGRGAARGAEARSERLAGARTTSAADEAGARRAGAGESVVTAHVLGVASKVFRILDRVALDRELQAAGLPRSASVALGAPPWLVTSDSLDVVATPAPSPPPEPTDWLGMALWVALGVAGVAVFCLVLCVQWVRDSVLDCLARPTDKGSHKHKGKGKGKGKGGAESPARAAKKGVAGTPVHGSEAGGSPQRASVADASGVDASVVDVELDAEADALVAALVFAVEGKEEGKEEGEAAEVAAT